MCDGSSRFLALFNKGGTIVPSLSSSGFSGDPHPFCWTTYTMHSLDVYTNNSGTTLQYEQGLTICIRPPFLF